MTVKLFFQAIIKFILGFVGVGALIFLSAWDIKFINGWIFMGLLFIPMFVAGIILMFTNPPLLEKRLNAKEKLSTQSAVIKLSGLMFIIGFIIAGLDYRFSWLVIPKWTIYIGIAFFVIGYSLYGEVLKENSYLSRTIAVEDNQKVVSTGLYGIIRHPMYFATTLMFLAIPIILGSIISFCVFLFYPIIIIVRLKNEEKFLMENLVGYSDYCKKVKFRLFPFIW